MSAQVEAVGQQKMEFLNLLVTELKNQNPLDPLNNQQMAAQLAQFSQLELSEKSNQNLIAMNETMGQMNSNFKGAMMVAEFDYARSLLGKEVEVYKSDSDSFASGRVEKIGVSNKGEPIIWLREDGVVGTTENPDAGVHTAKLYEISGIRN